MLVLATVLVINSPHPSLIPIFPEVKVMMERLYLYIGNIPLTFPGRIFYTLDTTAVRDLPTWNYVCVEKDGTKSQVSSLVIPQAELTGYWQREVLPGGWR